MTTLADLRKQGKKPDAEWIKKYTTTNTNTKSEVKIAPLEELAANERIYNYRISNEKADQIEALISQYPTEQQNELRQKAVAALKISDRYGISFQDAFDNIDLLQYEMYPKIKDIRTFSEELDRASKLADISNEIARVTSEFRKLSSTSKFRNISEEQQAKELANYEATLQALQQEQWQYEDSVPANSVAKAVGETVHSLLLMKTGLLAGGTVGLGVGLINPLAGTIAGSGTMYLINKELYANLAYADMFLSGIKDHEILERNAAITGSVQALTESILGMLPFGGIPDILLKGLAAKVAARFFTKRAAVSLGSIVAGKLGMEIVTKPFEMVLEGGEEGLQSVEFNYYLEKAASEYEKLLEEEMVQAQGDIAFQNVNWGNIYAAKEDVGESIKAGMAMALVMGVPMSFTGAVAGTVQ